MSQEQGLTDAGNPEKSGKTKVIAIIAVILALSALFIYTTWGKIYNEMNALKLIPQPERFTELYFENPAKLPRQAFPGKPISFAFTIHNLEGVETVYPYEVYFETPSGSQTSIISGSATVEDNATDTVNVTYLFPTLGLATNTPVGSGETGAIVVNLIQLKQQIDFLVPNTD